MVFQLIEKIDTFPNFKFLCVSVLLFPLSIGLGAKLFSTDSISYKRNDTEIKLGQIEQVIKQSDRLIETQQETIDDLVSANQEARKAARRKQVRLPELDRVDEIVNKSEELAVDLKENNKQLQTIVDDQPTEQPAVE